MEVVFIKVAPCNFVKNGLNHRCLYFLKACYKWTTEQNPHCSKKLNRLKIQQQKQILSFFKQIMIKFWELIVFAETDLSKEETGTGVVL